MKIEPLEPMRAANLVAALRFHKHPLTQQAADRIEALERAVAAEREACAKIAEEQILGTDEGGDPVFAYDVAAAIRARGDTKE